MTVYGTNKLWRTGIAGSVNPLWLLIVLIAVVLVVDFALTGIWTVQQNEQGVVLRFGAVSRRLGPGIQFTLPYPFETVEVVNTRETRKMPVGYRLMPGRDPTPSGPNEQEWLTGDTNVIDINMMIHYVVRDPVQYLFRLGPEEASFLIRKCAETMLTETIATMTVDDAFTVGKIEIQDSTRKGAQALLDQMEAGITITSANIQNIAPPAEVREWFNDVSRALADRERAIQEADGYKQDRLPRARAEANKIEQEALIYADQLLKGAQGRGERFLALCKEYSQAKEITRTRLLLETLERVLARAEKIIVTPDAEGNAHVRLVR
jgi:membrane protease subunit HflK